MNYHSLVKYIIDFRLCRQGVSEDAGEIESRDAKGCSQFKLGHALPSGTIEISLCAIRIWNGLYRRWHGGSLNIQQLRAICEVVEHELNISETARALHTSQAAISKQISAFEGEMQTAVFVRSKGRLTALTSAGRRIHVAAKNALGTIAEIRSICGSEKDAAPGHFMIAASRTLARDFLPDKIGSFMERYPGVEVSIANGSIDQMTNLLLNGEASLAITLETGAESERIVALPFGEMPRIVVVPRKHPLLRLRRLSLKAMSSFPLVLYDDTFPIRGEVLKAFTDAGLEPKVGINAYSAEVIKAHVSRDLGIAVLAESAYDPLIDSRLCAIAADHLFPPAITRILVNKYHFLKKFEFDFIQMCAPHWTRKRIGWLMEDKSEVQVGGASRPGR